MEIPDNYLNKLGSDIFGRPRNEWEEQISNFHEKLNKKGKPEEFSYARIAGCLANRGIRDAQEAYIFYEHVRKNARNFAALFTTLTKPQRPKPLPPHE